MDSAKRRSEERKQDAGDRRAPAGNCEHTSLTQQTTGWQRAWHTGTRRHECAVGALLLLGLALYVAGLGRRSLWAPDEGRYAEIPREMVATGDWLTPRLNGAKYFEKPPLHYWLVGAAFRLLGETELAARLPCALSALGGLLLVYGFGAACFGAEAGLLAALMLAVSPLYFILGRMDIIDTPLMVFYTLGMAAWGLALLQPERVRRRGCSVLGARCSAPTPTRLALSRPVEAEHRAPSTEHPLLPLSGWAGLALATLVKGPVALVLSVGTVVLWLLLTGQWNRWRALLPLGGIVVYFAITAPWFIAVSLKNPEFAWFFFVHEHLLRFLTTEHERKGPVYYYVPVLLVGFFPWSAWLPAALIAAVRSWALGRRQRESVLGGRGSRRAVFSTEHGLCQPAIQGGSAGASPSLSQHSREADLWLILWAAVPFVFFSASGSKLITYILPSIPALALLVAAWWPGSQARQDSVGPSAKLTVEPDDRVLGARCSVLGSGTDPTCPVPSEPSTEHRAPSTLSSEHPVLGGASLWRGTFGAAGVAALLAVLFPLLPRLVRKDAAPGVEPWLALAAAGLAVGAVLAPLFARRREPARVVVTLMGMAAVLLLALDRVEFTLDAVRGMRDLAGPVRARPEARLVMVNTYDQAFNFYSRHRAVIAGGVGELAFGRDHAPDAADYFRQEDALPTLLAERTPTFYLIHRKDRDRLQPLFEGRAHLVNEGRKHLLLLAPGDENVAR